MMRRSLGTLVLALGLVSLLAQPMIGPMHAATATDARAVAPAQHAAIAAHYGQLPLAFELNQGQTDPAIRFLAHGDGYTLALTPSHALLALSHASSPASPVGLRLPGQTAPERQHTAAPTTLSMAWLDANPHPLITGEQLLPGTINEFIGNNPAKWHTNIPTYQQVRLHNVYPGVDLVYYGNQGQLEYDFVVAPGANPAAIQLGFTGASQVGVDLAGNLSFALPGGTIAQQKPLVYQSVDGARQTIAGGYMLSSSQHVGFGVGDYNLHLPLVIDPSYQFSTYLGGSAADGGVGIAVDTAGNAYVIGNTYSLDFPVTIGGAYQTSNAGGQDVFVTKLNASGTTRVYSTYLGGSGADYAYGIAVDSGGNAYVTGGTSSTNFPTVNAVRNSYGGESEDAFVAKLNAAGTGLYYSTYLGGANVNDSNFAFGIAVDSGGNAYVTGRTNSASFPTTPGSYQPAANYGESAFVTKFNASGALAYSTYLGGLGDDSGTAIAVDYGGDAYVTGDTTSGNFPTTAGTAQPGYGGDGDVFVTKFNAAGSSLVYSTYLGGNLTDNSSGVAVDSGGNAYVTGETDSPNFPTYPVGSSSLTGIGSIFITKLTGSGTLAYSNYFGGSKFDSGSAIAVDASGDAYVTGDADSSDFVLDNPLQSHLLGSDDAFITKFNAAGSLPMFSTYLGGSGVDSGNGIAVGMGGNVYVTGSTSSTDFPLASPEQPRYGGGGDAFVTKIETRPTPVLTPGVFRPSNATFYLHNSSVSGVADESVTFGAGTDIPVAGDWTGKGYDSIGVFRNGTWYLRNSNTTGGADISLAFGTSGDIPLVGDWTGKGYDSVGIYRPSTDTFYLRNSNTTGAADLTIPFGTTGDIPIVGDWTGKGYDSIGVYRPSLGAFFLRNSNTPGGPNLYVIFGASGDQPVVGDWTGKGYDSIGVYRPSNSTFYLRNSNTGGLYADLVVTYGASGDRPLLGQWTLAPGTSRPFRDAAAVGHPARATPMWRGARQ